MGQKTWETQFIQLIDQTVGRESVSTTLRVRYRVFATPTTSSISARIPKTILNKGRREAAAEKLPRKRNAEINTKLTGKRRGGPCRVVFLTYSQSGDGVYATVTREARFREQPDVKSHPPASSSLRITSPKYPLVVVASHPEVAAATKSGVDSLRRTSPFTTNGVKRLGRSLLTLPPIPFLKDPAIILYTVYTFSQSLLSSPPKSGSDLPKSIYC